MRERTASSFRARTTRQNSQWLRSAESTHLAAVL